MPARRAHDPSSESSTNLDMYVYIPATNLESVSFMTIVYKYYRSSLRTCTYDDIEIFVVHLRAHATDK